MGPTTDPTDHGLAMPGTNVNTPHDTKRQTCVAGGKRMMVLRRGEVHVLSVNLTRSRKAGTLGLNSMCLQTIVRFLLFKCAFVEMIFVELFL